MHVNKHNNYNSSPLYLSPEFWPFSGKVTLFHVPPLWC